eukprot:TRINITY_DN14504_c0_g1_i1.p1 TRINITY_DN14504_c0_g1~~TRINITY_DN14504_c0_g1_i1.p1  ORF type:complete len:354 (+),score=62.20 TRINITY_DN14504_c0_g1_i1:68-1063(+)
MTVIITADEVKAHLSMRDCIGVVEESFRALHGGTGDMPLRFGYKMPLKENKVGILASMPSYLEVDGESYGGNKVITVYPANSKEGHHSHQGVVTLFEGNHGKLVGIVDAGMVTAIRTAAASGVATKLLSREDSEVLTLIGCGVQADQHLESMLLVRPSIQKVRIWNRTKENMLKFKKKWEEKPVEITCHDTVQEAVSTADIICTLTPSTSVLIQSEWVKDGAHINAVGGCTPPQMEVSPELVARSLLFADSKESCLKEPGDILNPLKSGLITPSHIKADIGTLLSSPPLSGRSSPADVTLFKSLGLAIQDLAAAVFLYKQNVGGNRIQINP